MSALIQNKIKSWDIFGVENLQALFKVVIGDISKEIPKLDVLFGEVLGFLKWLNLHTACPDGGDRIKQDILPPLFLDLKIDLCESLVLQGIY